MLNATLPAPLPALDALVSSSTATLLVRSSTSELRLPVAQWPDPVARAFAKINKKIYTPMQGPSEMGASGKLLNWDRTADLPKIKVPTLAIGARYDTMEPAQMQRIARSVAKGRYLYCPQGSHMAMYDDQKTYMTGLIKFILDVDAGSF